jgi:putative endonuclease
MGPLFITRMTYFVYILQSELDGGFYVGHTFDLKERIQRHNECRSLYTKGRAPWKLIYREVYGSRAEAMRREEEIKRTKSRKYIEQLVSASRV